MQVGGIGSGYDSHSHTHTVSNCVHDEDVAKKKSGSASAAPKTQTGEAQVNTGARNDSFSFFRWAENVFKGAKKIVGRIWESGSGDGDVKEEITDKGIVGDGMKKRISDKDTERQMAELTAQTMMTGQNGHGKDNAFLPPAEIDESHTMFQKLKYKVQALTGFLAKHFAFAGKQNFNARQENPQEDLQKRRRYTHNGVIIDSVQPNDSHLMDSYDKKGAYSKISTKR